MVTAIGDDASGSSVVFYRVSMKFKPGTRNGEPFCIFGMFEELKTYFLM